MFFDILASSSKGNCFFINHGEIIIDMGKISYKKISEALTSINQRRQKINLEPVKVKAILLTHEHGDHFHLPNIRNIIIDYNPLFIGGDWLLDKVILSDKKRAVEAGKAYKIADYIISPVTAYHDVYNFGYRIMYKRHKHIHVTDSAHLEGITAKDYDSASLECNHCEEQIQKLIEQAEINNDYGKLKHLKGAVNSHLSVQQSVKFCEENNIKTLYACHIGESTKNEVMDYLAFKGYQQLLW